MIERCGGLRRGREECVSGEEMRVCDVEHVGEVKEVVVLAELEAGFVGWEVGGERAGDGLHVAFAEDGGGAEGAG